MTNSTLALASRALAAITFVALSASVQAQMTPVGQWHSFDEKSALTGRITKLLRKDADQKKLCTECSDDRKDKPVLGLEIIRGAKKAEGKDVWEDGKILDPENGKNYTLRLTPIEDGKKLEVRGSIAFFGRTQTWTRVQ